jgi:hypothetical protein
MCVYSLGYPARKAHAPYRHLWPVWHYHVFPHYLMNGAIFGTKYSYTKTNQMHQFLKLFILVNALHVSDGLSVHHQELKTAHTATGVCQTAAATCC